MSKTIVTISQDFTFEAAHSMPAQKDLLEQTQIHGHSFSIRIELSGEVNPESGTVENFELVHRKFDDLINQLDHRYLNDIEGLETPTMENIGFWVLSRGQAIDRRLNAVTVGRPTLGQTCRIVRTIT